MSKQLRLPFALLAILALFLLSPGVAAADDTSDPLPADCAADGLAGCTDVVGDEVVDPSDQSGDVVDPSDELPPAPAADAGDDQQSPGLIDGDAADEPAASENTTGETDDSTGADEGAGTPEGEGSGDPDPAAVGGCIGAVLQGLLTDLQAQVGNGVDDLAAAIQDGLTGLDPTDPDALSTFLEGLPELGESTIPDLTEEGQALLSGAAVDIQACLPEPPDDVTPPPTDNPPVEQPVQQPTQPPAVYYANCDDARAQGAAPVHAGQPGYRSELDRDSDGIGCEDEIQNVASTQPTGTLAYTGVEVGGLVRLGAILVAGGTLVLLAGVRRRA
jgi:hypothetical protein